MKRILMMVFRNILLVPYMWCKLCYYASHVEKYTEKQRYDMLKFIVKRANRGGNVHIDVHGQDNIPKEDGFMFFPNHQTDHVMRTIGHPLYRYLRVSKKVEQDI